MASGPFFPVPDVALGLTPTNYDFTQFTADNLNDTDATLGEVDGIILQVLGDLTDPSDPTPDFDYFGLVDSLAATDFVDEATNHQAIIDAAPSFQTLLTDSVNTAPDVSFLPQPPPYNPGADPTVNLNFPIGAQPPPITPPPGITGIQPIAPGVPIAAPEQPAPTAPTFTSGFNTLVTAQGYTIDLVDLTTFNFNSMVVGDSWKLTITGPPFQTISREAWQAGVHFPSAPIGQFDGNGVFTQTGVMGPGDVPGWSWIFYGGDVLINNVAFFVVNAL